MMHVLPRSFWGIHEFHDNFIRQKRLIQDVMNVGSINSSYKWCVEIIFLQWRRILFQVCWTILNCLIWHLYSRQRCTTPSFIKFFWMYFLSFTSLNLDSLYHSSIRWSGTHHSSGFGQNVNGKLNSDVMEKTGAVWGVDVGGGILKIPMREESLNIPTPTSWITFEFSTKGTFEWIPILGV